MSKIRTLPATTDKKLDLRFEGAELGCGAVLTTNSEKYVSIPSRGDDKFLNAFSQYESSVRSLQNKIYARKDFTKQQKDRDGNFGYQDNDASMKYVKSANVFVPSASEYKPPSEKDEKVDTVLVEKAECDTRYGTARTIETNAMKRLGQIKIKEEERDQADKAGYLPGGRAQYGFAFNKYMEGLTRVNQREMPQNLVTRTRDEHSIDMQQYMDSYGTVPSKMDKQLDVQRNPNADPNAPRESLEPPRQFNVVQQEASMEQQQYQRLI